MFPSRDFLLGDTQSASGRGGAWALTSSIRSLKDHVCSLGRWGPASLSFRWPSAQGV